MAPVDAVRWSLFRQEAAEAGVRLGAALARQPRDLEEAGRAAFALATAAALVRYDELSRLGRALRAAVQPAALASSAVESGPSASRPHLDERQPLHGHLLVAAAELPPFLADLPPRPEDAPALPPALGLLLARLEDLGDGPSRSSAPLPSPPAAPAGPAGPERFTPLVEEDLVEPFLEESQERIEALGQKLVQLEGRRHDGELVADIFRDLHTLKGSSAFVGLRTMNRLAHAAEDLVGQLRSGARVADRPTVDALLGALDALRAIVAQASRRAPIQIDLEEQLRRLRSPGQPDHAPRPPTAGADGADAPKATRGEPGRQTLRVDFDKLDLLLNLVGELVLDKSRLRGTTEGVGQLGRELGAELRRLRRGPLGAALPPRLDEVQRLLEQLAGRQEEDLSKIDHVAADLRDQVMRLRMVPIGRIFNKHHRTVRALGRALGRAVQLEVEGEGTELDKLLVEQLDDPLLHLVRNAIDHGLEPPDERLAAGKPAAGTLRLRAWHRGSQIVIEVSDDGRGIDPAAVRARALDRGLGAAEEVAQLDDEQSLRLIFRPGFSTATQVSEVSGRGVGLDVVQRAVQRLKGSVEVHAERGRGTRFLLRLPLTLAIIQVLLVQVRGQRFALPLDHVVRALPLRAEAVRRACDRELLLLDLVEQEQAQGRDLSRDPRGPLTDPPPIPAHAHRDAEEVSAAPPEEVPLLDVGAALGLGGALDPGAAQAILVEHGGARWALRCDRQLGKREIVVKSLGELLGALPCVAGATLIDDRVVLLLDIGQLVQRAAGRPAAPAAADPARAPRILLAEDSELEREALARTLRQAGYDVTVAADGREALALAAADRRGFDLISTDVTMPHLDGYELTRRLRAQERHRDVPILMLTARAEPLDRVRGFEAGVDEYLLKPADPALLVRTVARHLAQAGAAPGEGKGEGGRR